MTRTANHRTERGNALVELALALLLFWLILTGAFHYGYSTYIYAKLAAALAEAGRYAAHVDFDSPQHNFAARVANVAVYGSPAGGSQPQVPGLTVGNIGVQWTLDPAGYPKTLSVEITGYRVTTPFRSWTISGKPRVTVRFAGRYVVT